MNEIGSGLPSTKHARLFQKRRAAEAQSDHYHEMLG